MLRKRIQIGLLHVAAAITLLPISGTLNRVMIKELALSATLVSLLIVLPYLFSPMQVALGSYQDRNPILGLRRTPYIVFGLLMCIGGALLTPAAAFALGAGNPGSLAFAIIAFGLWGMGYNFATVSYFALASEISGESKRSATIAFMFTMMVISLIVMGIIIASMVEPYSPEALQRAFYLCAGIAFLLMLLGLIKLETRANSQAVTERQYSIGEMYNAILENKQALTFFIYLILLLSAILGQDVLLEPFAGEAFGLSVGETSRITPVWGGLFLIAMVIPIARWLGKTTVARAGTYAGLIAFALIIVSGVTHDARIFWVGVAVLGTATGLATVSNLSIMLDMTAAGNVGLYIGAWGVSGAFARLTGILLAGVVRDGVTALGNGDLVLGYLVVFAVEFIFLAVSLALFSRISVEHFQKQAVSGDTFIERAALVGEVGGG